MRREREREGGSLCSPDIAVPAELDQFFVCRWWGQPLDFSFRREQGGRGRGRTFEFVFAYIDGCWGVDYVGGEVVDHCRCRRWFEKRLGELSKGEGYTIFAKVVLVLVNDYHWLGMHEENFRTKRVF